MKNRRILRKYSAILVMNVLAMFLFKACTKVPVENGMITMTTKASEVWFHVQVTGDISVYWGDGKVSNRNDAIVDDYSDENGFSFTHEYSGTNVCNIVITGNVTSLTCYANWLTALDVSMNTALEILSCGGNQLTTLDVSRNTALTFLNCRRNQLTTLDVSRNTALTNLDCSDNQLTTLDVSKNTALKGLGCNFTQIKSLDISKNTAMEGLSVVGNQFTATALNEIFRMLPDYSKRDNMKGIISIMGYHPSVSDNPGNLDCDRSIARERGWYFMSYR